MRCSRSVIRCGISCVASSTIFLSSLLIYCPLFARYGLSASIAAHVAWNVCAPIYNPLLLRFQRLLGTDARFLTLELPVAGGAAAVG